MDYGKRLKSARVHAGMTQRTLARRVQISASAISSYEKGTRKPDIEIFHQIATVLETPYAFFFGDDAVGNQIPSVLGGKGSVVQMPARSPEYDAFEPLFRELADDRDGKWNWMEFNHEFCTAQCKEERVEAIWKLFRRYLMDDPMLMYRYFDERDEK